MYSLTELSQKEQAYQKPSEVGAFSLDSDRKFHNDRRQMSYYVNPNPPLGKRTFNLSDGYGTKRYIKRDEKNGADLSPMLEWMVANKFKFDKDSSNKLGLPKVVTWRGNLTKIMITPHERYDDWMFAAQKFNGVVYINNIETERLLNKRKNTTEMQEEMCYWGHKFEKYVTKPCNMKSFSNDQMKNSTVNTHEGYVSVVSSKFGKDLSIIIGAEVDCAIDHQSFKPPSSYIELKTNRHFKNNYQEQNFWKFKALKWWSQSFLNGIPSIVCGFRDDRGYVDYIQEFKTLQIPSIAKNYHQPWSGTKCINFVGNILNKVVDFLDGVEENDTVCLFKWDFKSDFVEFKIDESSEHAFLPDWFINSMLN